MIYISGDTHGEIDINKLESYFNKRYVSNKDFLIILGDAGIVWDKKCLDKYVFRYKCLGPTIFFIDGNHENFNLLNSFPVIKKNNARVHVIDDNLYHVLRGELLIINKLKFLCIGGAESIDKVYRTKGKSWWKEETITEYEIDHALFNVACCDYKVDYVLTHTAPASISKNKLGYNPSESNIQLERINDKVKFNKWYFGHYHIDRIINDRFRCFYNDVLEIPVLDSDKDIGYKELHAPSIYNPSIDYPYLKNYETGRKTKLTEGDLSEWYYVNFSYHDTYYCLKGVVDVAYKGSPFDNHISKDSRIYLSYKDKIEKNDDYSPKNENELFCTWRTNIKEFTYGLEKYSPNLDLRKLKEKINLTYDQYNRNPSNYYNGVYVRPFPEIKTEIIKDIKYRVIQNNNILCEFYNFESAKEYASTYISKNLRLKNIRVIEDKQDELSYDTSHDINKWVKIVRIKRRNH